MKLFRRRPVVDRPLYCQGIRYLGRYAEADTRCQRSGQHRTNGLHYADVAAGRVYFGAGESILASDERPAPNTS